MRERFCRDLRWPAVWASFALGACHAGTIAPGEFARPQPSQKVQADGVLPLSEQTHSQDARDAEMKVVFLSEATPNEAAVAEQQLFSEETSCRRSEGRWDALWLSCACPPAQSFIAGQGCARLPTLVLAHAGCDGSRSDAPTACFRYIRLGPLMLDLNFAQARRLLPLLRHGAETDAVAALLEDAHTTLPDETKSDVRLHQTHRLKENIAAFALAAEPWLRIDPPHYVSPATPGPPRSPAQKGRVPAVHFKLAPISGLSLNASADLSRVVRETQTYLCRVVKGRRLFEMTKFRVHLANNVVRRTLYLPEVETKGAGKVYVKLIITLRDGIPLARILRFDFGDGKTFGQSGILDLYLSPRGALRGSAFRFATAGPTTAWHFFDAQNRALTKVPLRTLINPEASLYSMRSSFSEKR